MAQMAQIILSGGVVLKIKKYIKKDDYDAKCSLLLRNQELRSQHRTISQSVTFNISLILIWISNHGNQILLFSVHLVMTLNNKL